MCMSFGIIDMKEEWQGRRQMIYNTKLPFVIFIFYLKQYDENEGKIRVKMLKISFKKEFSMKRYLKF